MDRLFKGSRPLQVIAEGSYAHDTLMLTIRDVRRLVKCYGLAVDMPTEVHREHKPPKGYAIVSKSFLKFRVQFSLN